MPNAIAKDVPDVFTWSELVPQRELAVARQSHFCGDASESAAAHGRLGYARQRAGIQRYFSVDVHLNPFWKWGTSSVIPSSSPSTV